ncbi:MAG: aminopeptidase P family protein [Planctomycetota bacterium]|nr:MAG: aminopeptidase P family protein [Planctomycetota bacterium]
MPLLSLLLALNSASIPLADTRAPDAKRPDDGASNMARAANGAPYCGLGKAFHAGRRAELRKQLKKGWVLVRGLPDTRDYTAFRQDKVFWYLTGIETPNVALLMNCESGEEILFLPRPDKRNESWEGEKWDSRDAWVAELAGFTDVRENDTLVAVVKESVAREKRVWISMHPTVDISGAVDRAWPFDSAQAKDPLDGRTSREKVLKEQLEKLGAEPKDMAGELSELRRIKQPEEVDALRRSCRAGAIAMMEAIRSTQAGIYEGDLGALMSFVQQREGADGPGYQPITGSGPNSCVLHYSGQHRRLGAGEMMLIDFGPELDHYVTDITRSWPVDGKFTARQLEMYEAVRASQEAGIAVIKPGAKLRDVEKACAEVLAARGFKNFTKHGVSHFVGLEVHDVGDFGKPLEPGVTFVVEPGLYDEETGIGIRIEDVVVVTETGCDVLTRECPRDPGEVERLMAETGVLERMGAR